MALRFNNFCLRHKRFPIRFLSTEAAPLRKIPVARRTSADPLTQTEDHCGYFYTIPQDVCKDYFAPEGLTKAFQNNATAFNESSILIRPHAIELLNYLKNADYSHPVVRYVVYGKTGSGKSLTVSHMMHYAYLCNFMVLHVPWVWNWYRNNFTEVANSDTKAGMYNIPVLAASWLKNFQQKNAHILSNPDLRITKDYVWGPRETSAAGTPLTELITHGISRIRYSCDVVDAVVNEVKFHTSQGRVKTLIAIDGFNQFFLPFSNIKNAEKKKVIPDQVTLTQTFLSAVKADWTNGAVIVTVDQLNTREKDASPCPLYLLKKRGFEILDPFIPIEVPELSETEFHLMLDYYEDRRWLQKAGAREELEFISARNPQYLVDLCASL